MLPNFEKLNTAFAKAVSRAVRHMARQDGVLREIKTHALHEGRNSSIRRPDDSVEQTEVLSAEASVSMSFDEMENVSLELILDRLTSMAKQFQKQQVQHFFDTLNEVTTRTGQVHNAQGKPLTNEDIFAMFEKMQLDFERNPDVGDASVIASPNMIPVFKRLDEEMERSPDLQRRWKAILEKKKSEYREREINRNLDG